MRVYRMSLETRQKISAAQKGIPKSESARMKMRKPKNLSQERRNECAAAMRRLHSLGFGRVKSAETRRKISEALKGKTLSDEVKRKLSEKIRGKSKTGRAAKGVNHSCAVKGWLRSPDGRVFKYRNLSLFVRENPHLFPPETVVWKPQKNYPSRMSCLAQHGLSQIVRPNAENGSWKGWTRVSELEIEMNYGRDLLERESF